MVNKINKEALCSGSPLYALTQAEYQLVVACMTFAVDEGEIVMNGKIQDFIEKECKIVSGTIRNTLVRLVQKGILIKDKRYRGIYYLNEKYFNIK